MLRGAVPLGGVVLVHWLGALQLDALRRQQIHSFKVADELGRRPLVSIEGHQLYEADVDGAVLAERHEAGQLYGSVQQWSTMILSWCTGTHHMHIHPPPSHWCLALTRS